MSFATPIACAGKRSGCTPLLHLTQRCAGGVVFGAELHVEEGVLELSERRVAARRSSVSDGYGVPSSSVVGGAISVVTGSQGLRRKVVSLTLAKVAPWL